MPNNPFSKLLSGLGSFFAFIIKGILFLAFLWGEFGGLYHSFRYHNDVVIAFLVPPIAWYRSIEFFWCKERRANDIYISQPELSTDEYSEMSLIFNKAFEDSLTDEDISRLKQLYSDFEHRTGEAFDEKDVYTYETMMEAKVLYEREVGRCILSSIDSEQPFYSDDYKKLKKLLKQYGYVHPEKLKRDHEKIKSAGFRTPWTDELGMSYYPPSREEALEGLRDIDILEINNKKIVAMMFEIIKEREKQ